MQHLPQVLKILDGALRHDTKQAYEYAGLLAELLEQEGQRGQALRIRERLARTPRSTVQPALAAMSGERALPIDQGSGQKILDEFRPQKGDVEVLLPDVVERRLSEFYAAIHYHEALADAGVAEPARLLLHGPPGVGKTQTALAVAAELALPLLTVRCDTLVSSLLGQTGKNLRRVFEHAIDHPCVLFLDEFDALAKRRSDDREVGELQRVVIALLQNIDALPSSTILVAATNHADLLDPAVWRRFAFRIELPLPDARLRELLWRKLLGRFAADKLDWKRLVRLSEGLSGAAIEQAARDALRGTIIRGEAAVEEPDLLRRLGTTVAMEKRIPLHSQSHEIQWLRAWLPAVFSIRQLAHLYRLSERQIRTLIQPHNKDDEHAEHEPHPSHRVQG
jgi:SpoVK/Ycf46/Vps4 family AAA+-type ATPase